MRRWIVLGWLNLSLLAVASGCTSGYSVTDASTRPAATSRTPTVRDALLAPAPRIVMVECRRTARTVGYAVPCPTRLLLGMTPFGGDPNRGPRCQMRYIGPELCDRRWKGWVVGSSVVGNEHLVIVASPRAQPDYARLINGPAWYPGATEQLDGWITIHGWRARWVTVPAATNDGSAFMGHIVLVWTVGRHTYGVGFHDVSRNTRALDLELLRSIRLIRP